MKKITFSCLAVLVLSSVAQAQDAPMSHHDHTAAPVSAFDETMMTMHENMQATKPTGDVDIDFVKGMIPHHQAAVDMAKIELEKGKDPAIRKLAEEIVKSQEAEITMMNQWLKDRKAD